MKLIQGIRKFFKLSYINDDGYKQVYKPNNSHSNREGFVPEHRLVAARTAKRRLNSEDIVHHKDGDKLNNSANNLQITTKRGHYFIHHKRKGTKKSKF